MDKDETLNYTLEVDLEKEWWDDFWWTYKDCWGEEK